MKNPAKRRKEKRKMLEADVDSCYKKLFKNICALILIVVFVLSFLSELSAQNTFSEEILLNTKVHEYTLDNGLDILISEKPNSDLVALEIIVKTGSLFEENKLGSGLAHLVEHMLFKGTKTRTSADLDDQIRSLGGIVNGYTSYQFSGYTLVLPKENFKQGLDILSDMIMNPAFDEDEIEKEKGVILSEIKMNQDDPQRYFQRQFWKHAFLITPFNLPIIGLEPLFLDLKKDDLVEFYRKWYISNNTIVSVAGNIQKEEALEKIKESFKTFNMGNFPEFNLPTIPPIKGRNIIEEEYNISTSRMIIGFQSVVLTDKDSAVLDIISTVLGNGKSSRLYNSLVTDKQIAYSTNSFNYTPGFKGILAISLLIDYNNKEKVIENIFNLIHDIQKNSITKKELEKVKNQYLAEFASFQETVASLAKVAATDKAYTNNVLFTRNYIKNIKSITLKDIKKCANKYLSDKNHLVYILKPYSKTLEEDKERKTFDAKIEKVVLDNGLRVILKQDPDVATVTIHACFEGGVRRETPENNGVFNVLAEMLLKGTKKRSESKISSEIEQLGASISSFSGYNSFGLNINFLEKDFEDAIDIFADLILNSKFPEIELKWQKRLTTKQLTRQEEDIFQNTFNILKKNLFSKASYRLNPLGSVDSIKKINSADLKEKYREYVHSDNLVLSVFGNFDKDIALKKIEKSLGRIKSAELITWKNPQEEVFTFKELEVKYDEKEQAIIMVAFPGCSIDNKDKIKLEFLNSLLADAGSILYKQIREKHGTSYTLGGNYVSGLDTGFFYVYVATVYEAIDDVKKIVFDEIKKIKEGKIAIKDIETTKKSLISSKRISRETNSSLGFTVSLNELYGLGLDYYKQEEEQINKINVDSLTDIANKYLDFEKSITVYTKAQ